MVQINTGKPQLPYVNMILSNLERALLYIIEQWANGFETFSLLIAKHFKWSRVKTKRIIDKLTDGDNKYNKKFISKINFCPECLKRYNRIPKICECGNILINQPVEFKNPSEQPLFLITPNDEAIEFIKEIESWGKSLYNYSKNLNNKLYQF